MKKNKQDNNPQQKTKGGKRGLIFIISGVLVVLSVFGLTLLLVGSSDNNGGNDVEPGRSYDPLISELTGSEVYDPCDDDVVAEELPLCYVDTIYPLDFLNRFKSQPTECWVAVNGFAYNVTQGEGGYEYPGSESLDDLCGQDASERFDMDQVDPPPLEYLEGSVSG